MSNQENQIQVPIEDRFIPGNDTLFKSRHKTIDITEEEYNKIQEIQNVVIVKEQDNSEDTENSVKEEE